MARETIRGSYKARLIREHRYPLPLDGAGAAFWAARSLWTVDQAACLTFGFEPRSLVTTFRSSLAVIMETMREENADPNMLVELQASIMDAFGTIRAAILAEELASMQVDELDAQSLQRVLLVDAADEVDTDFLGQNRDFLLLRSQSYAEWLRTVEGRSMPRIADPLRSALRFAKEPIMERLARHQALLRRLHYKFQAERRLMAKVDARLLNNAFKWMAFMAKVGLALDETSSLKAIGDRIAGDGRIDLLSAPGEPATLQKYLIVANECLKKEKPSWSLLGRGDISTAKSTQRHS